MSTIQLRLYELLRREMKLSDDKAHEFVQIIEEAIREDKDKRFEQTITIVNKDIAALRQYMDATFATKEDLAKLEGKLSTKLSETKAEMIKWMFLFWIAQVVTTFGFILLFLKK